MSLRENEENISPDLIKKMEGIINSIRNLCGLTPAKKCMLIVLATYLNEDGYAQVSVPLWAEGASCRKSTIIKYKKLLIASGYISFFKKGKNIVKDAYKILIKPT